MCFGGQPAAAAEVKTAAQIAEETKNVYANPISGTDTSWWNQTLEDKNITPKSRQMLTARLNLTKK